MSTRAIIYLCLIIVLVLFSAYFSLTDVVYSTVNELRLEKRAKQGNASAIRALSLVKNYDRTISTILFGNDLANVAATILGTSLAGELWGPDNPSGPLIMSLILLFTILFFGEIVPKSIGKSHSFGLSLRLGRSVRFFEMLFFPVVSLVHLLEKAISHPFKKKKIAPEEAPVPEDEELEAMVDEIEEEGIIDSSKSELLHRSIDFKDTTAEEIMTPRVDIVGYDVAKPLSEWVKEKDVLRHSRIIVYRHYYDNILGYIPTKALLKAMLDDKPLDYQELMLPILSVPSTMEISSILRFMKQSHHHIAVVRDEYGGTAGILTLEDILEELVGELYDESEKVELYVRPTNKRNVYLVSGKMGIHDFYDRFHLDEEEVDESYNTVSGWVNDRLGRFAAPGDSFQEGPIDVEVSKASSYVVEELRVTYHPRRKQNED